MKGYFEVSESFSGELNAYLADSEDTEDFIRDNPGCDPENIRISDLSSQLKDDIMEDLRKQIVCGDWAQDGDFHDCLSFKTNGVDIEIDVYTGNTAGNPFTLPSAETAENNPFYFPHTLANESDIDTLIDDLCEKGRFDRQLETRDYLGYIDAYRESLEEAFEKAFGRSAVISNINNSNADIDPYCDIIKVNGQGYTDQGLDLCNALKTCGHGKFADELARSFESRGLIPEGEYVPARKVKEKEMER